MRGVSWLREILHTMQVPRSGRPFMDILRMAGTLGSSATESAAIMPCTMEEMQDIIEAKGYISIKQADNLLRYLEALWWWHTYRDSRKESQDPVVIKGVYVRCQSFWGEMPHRFIHDWTGAYELRCKTIGVSLADL